ATGSSLLQKQPVGWYDKSGHHRSRKPSSEFDWRAPHLRWSLWNVASKVQVGPEGLALGVAVTPATYLQLLMAPGPAVQRTDCAIA
ncbi:MAG: hypothetical protein ACK511_08870, partial [Burkholderiales bacterium]